MPRRPTVTMAALRCRIQGLRPARNVTQSRALQRMGSEKQHVKLWITDGQATHEAVWWGAGKEASLPVGRFDVAFVPQVNEFNGRRAVQLKILDWRAV